AGCQEVNGMILFGIEDLEGQTVGGLSLHSQDRVNGTFSFGITVARQHWGRGYARDAVRILMRYGFWEQRYQKCNSACAHSNEPSMRMHRGLGFVEEGRRRRQMFYDGRYHDEVLWGMTREEFDALEGRGQG
ncbi:MAG: GNAT family N-acetyltransferase, partial [Anaerolineae bacterium]